MLTADELREVLVAQHDEGYPGVFLCVEGADGVGKTTIAQELRSQLTDKHGKNRRVLLIRNPETTGACGHIRAALLYKNMTVEEQILLFTAARRSLAEQILPELHAGSIVIVDRWLLSSIVYQAACGAGEPTWTPRLRREERLKLVMQLHKQLVNLTPDATVILTASASVVNARLADKHNAAAADVLEADAARCEARRALFAKYANLVAWGVTNDRGSPADIAGHVLSRFLAVANNAQARRALAHMD